MEMNDLIGKTIISAVKFCPIGYEEDPYLRLDFTDGTHCFLEGGYRSFDCDISRQGEYPCFIDIIDEIEEIVEYERNA